MIQEPPNCVQIELTEGCNLYCNFCGLQGIREKPGNYKFMTPSLAETLASRIKEAGWNSRLEFAMHGEPTMNPDIVEILEIFRKYLPRHSLMMTSNGGGLLKGGSITDNINRLFKAGLNILALDNYEYVNIVPKVEEGYKGPYPIWYYPEEGEDASPHRRRRPDEHDIIIVQDISVAVKGSHSVLNNHAGAAFPPNDKAQGKRCGKPFRELSVRWDGNVAICCNDWRGYYRIGNVAETDLESLWQSDAMVAARKKLYHGMRDFGPCKGCDALTYRPGLLPDRMGQKSLPLPDHNDEAIIEKALSQGPYTEPVLRPWELTVKGRKL